MFPIHNDTWKPRPQHASNELRQFSIAENGCAPELSNIDLREDFASGREWFNKDGLFVAHLLRHAAQIFKRQGKIFGKCSIVAKNSEYRAPSTMGFQAALAEAADGAIAKRRTRNVDYASDARSNPLSLLRNGNSSDVSDFSNKLMTWRSAKPVVPTEDFDVGVADARKAHFDQRPASAQFWNRLLHSF
jgi:hypothetical protein